MKTGVNRTVHLQVYLKCVFILLAVNEIILKSISYLNFMGWMCFSLCALFELLQDVSILVY